MGEELRTEKLEAMQRYIDLTNMKQNIRYALGGYEGIALWEAAHRPGNEGFSAILLAYALGQARGYRQALKEVRS